MAKKLNTKDKILEVALELFSRHGFAGTSIRQIAKKVGIRESAIYNHFPSKEKIFGNIVSQFKSTAIGTEILSDDLIDDLGDPYIFMNNFCERLVRHWNSREERKFIRLLLMEQYRETKESKLAMSDYLNEARSIWWMIFDELVKHNFIKKIDPKILANEFIAPLFFIRVEYLSTDDPKNFDQVLDLVKKHVDFFWQAVKK